LTGSLPAHNPLVVTGSLTRRHRGCGGAGGFWGGRCGGRVGLGTGGAGVVLRRTQPSKSWRDPRFLTDYLIYL